MKKLLLLILFLAVAGFAFYLFSNKNPYSTNKADFTSFAISDTASVGTIFIADSKGRTITLKRGPQNRWTVNDTYPAREDAVDVLLKTFHDIYVQRPVPKNGEEHVKRIMAGSNNKVEIYDLNGNWIKTWYVGYGTMDKKGTMMILENKSGISPHPYIMDLRGFIGMLDTRFFTNLNEWRNTIIFNYKNMGLEDIRVIFPQAPESSFRIAYGGGNDISLFSLNPETKIENFDTSRVKEYMLNFKLASFENYNTRLTPQQEDSIKQQVPVMIIEVKDPADKKRVTLWTKAPPEGQKERSGEPAKIDREYFYGMNTENELATAQRYIWDKFYVPLTHFQKE